MFIKLLAKYHAYKLNEDGATAIEYGLIAGGISLAIVAAVFAFGEDLKAMFENIGTAMDSAAKTVDGGGGGTPP
jgi:pilus assembly protein Flp/PilA